MVGPARRSDLYVLTALLVEYGAAAAPLSSASSGVPIVPNGTFEAPALRATPGFEYGPSGSGWTLVNGAGLSRNASGFTAGNPGAPGGSQVLFLQG
jgi:hypothetical protein